MKKHADKFGRKAQPELIPAPKANKRPVHKENLRLRKAEAEYNRTHPAVMQLFRKREKDGEIPEKTLARPMVSLGQIDKAASAMAAWDNSDPFAYGRTALYVKQGYLQSDVVIKEMSQRTMARRIAKAREVDNANAQ